jgi:hypothetical protein
METSELVAQVDVRLAAATDQNTADPDEPEGRRRRKPTPWARDVEPAAVKLRYGDGQRDLEHRWGSGWPLTGVQQHLAAFFRNSS